jgi:hypothetical protein
MAPILGIIASSNFQRVTSSYYSIATTTLGTATASITFSSIPSTYTHLELRMKTVTSGLGWVTVVFNSDTGNNYSWHELRGDGSSASASAAGNAGNISAYLQSSQQGSGVFSVLDYANTGKYKTAKTLGGYDDNGSGYVTQTSGVWRNTAAITSITITHSTSSYSQYSSFALYGIKGA